MKVCPTCEKQFPNGFQYCPNDTELLLTAEEYLRKTQTISAISSEHLSQRLPAPTPPTVTEVLSDTPAPLPVVPAEAPYRTQEISRVAPPVVREAAPAPPAAPVPPAAQVPPAAPVLTPQSTTQTGGVQGAKITALPGKGVQQNAKAPGIAEDDGVSFMIPEQGSLFKRVGEGFGIFFSYFGKKSSGPIGEGRFAIPEQASLLARIKEGAGLFVAYFGKSGPTGENEFLVPESGSIVKRLRESVKLAVDDFGKKTPQLKPGDLGDFEFLLKDEPIYTRVARELKNAGTDFRRDPKGFVVSVLKGDGTTKRRQRLLQAGVATAMIAYAFIFTSFLLGGLLNFGKKDKPQEEKLELLGELTVPPSEVRVKDAPKETPKGKGGFTGGSKPKPEQAHGGGGGGREQQTPASKGNPPQMALTPQIVMPDPEPPKIKNPSLPVAATVYGDPKALPELKGPIGDPRGAPAPPSSGPGTVAGIGSGAGTGVGPGSGGGAGPGRGGNAGGGDAEFGGGKGPGGAGGVYTMGQDGVGRIQILFKEKAKYTEEARQNKIQGTVVLSAVFTSDGQVTNVRVIRGLPDGLTEKAIEAAKKIRFQPATKNGAAVTVRGQLEFTFNLY